MRGQVAIVLQGRQAGKKVVVIKQLDEGTKERPYPHAIVAGVERYPRKVTRRMGQKKLKYRSKVKPFIKVRGGCCWRGEGFTWCGCTGRELLASVPDTVRARAGRFEGDRHVGHVQGAVTARRLEEDDQEAA